MGASEAELVALGVVFLIIPLIFVFLRFWARAVGQKGVGVDDWLILLALLLIIGLCLSQILGATLGNLGAHELFEQDNPTPIPTYQSAVERQRQTTYALNLLYPLCNGLIKLSLVFLYRRLFLTASRSFNISSILYIVTIALWTLSFFFGSIAICQPVSAFWSIARSSDAKCYPGAFFDILGITDLITAVMVLALPVPPVLEMGASIRRRLLLAALFLLGVLVIVAGAIRLCYFLIQGTSALEGPDSSYYSPPLEYWSIIETSLGIVCASLPTLEPLINRPPHRPARPSSAEDELTIAPTITVTRSHSDQTRNTSATMRDSEHTASDKTHDSNASSLVWPLPPTSPPFSPTKNPLAQLPISVVSREPSNATPRQGQVLPTRQASLANRQQTAPAQQSAAANLGAAAIPSRQDSLANREASAPVIRQNSAGDAQRPVHRYHPSAPRRQDSLANRQPAAVTIQPAQPPQPPQQQPIPKRQESLNRGDTTPQSSAQPATEVRRLPPILKNRIPPTEPTNADRRRTGIVELPRAAQTRTPILMINGAEVPVLRDSRGEGLGTFYSHDTEGEDDV